MKMTKKRLMIAEDETLIRMHLKQVLVELGYLVVGEAGDGVTAINLARDLRPDLVMMDIKMPRLDGLSATRVLVDERVAPVVLLTAYNGREYIERARTSGVGAYLLKPFRDGDLMPAVETAMARYADLLRIDKEVRTLRDSMEGRKLVERAKGMLMETQGLSETEAYRRMEQLAMSSGKSMKEIADALLIARDITRRSN